MPSAVLIAMQSIEPRGFSPYITAHKKTGNAGFFYVVAEIAENDSNSALDLLVEWNKYLERQVPEYSNQPEQSHHTPDHSMENQP